MGAFDVERMTYKEAKRVDDNFLDIMLNVPLDKRREISLRFVDCKVSIGLVG